MDENRKCPQCGNTVLQGHKLDCTRPRPSALPGNCPDCGAGRNKAGYFMCTCVHLKPGAPFGGQWIVTAKGAHPLWDQYALVLYDLTTKLPGQPDPVIRMEGATHEFLLFALQPRDDVGPYPTGKIETTDWIENEYSAHFLSPANHGYQFKSVSDELAEKRIQRLYDRIADGSINPDTDHRQTWHQLFRDGEPMVTSIFEGMELPDAH